MENNEQRVLNMNKTNIMLGSTLLKFNFLQDCTFRGFRIGMCDVTIFSLLQPIDINDWDT